MNTHLVKCKKNYPDAKLVECDFNVNHKIPEPELQVGKHFMKLENSMLCNDYLKYSFFLVPP